MRTAVIILVVVLAIAVIGNIYFMQSGLADREFSNSYVRTEFRVLRAKEDKPEDVPLLYMHTFSSGDYHGALQYLTPEYGEAIRAGINRFFAELEAIPDETLIDYQVGELEVFGDNSVLVPVRTITQVGFEDHYDIETTDWDFYLVRQGSQWKIEHVTEVETSTRQISR